MFTKKFINKKQEIYTMKKFNFITILFIFSILLLQVSIAEDITPVDNTTLIETPTGPEISMNNFIPKEFIVGDNQFNIQVQNKKVEEINNVVASISGKGFSTYDVIPINSLGPNEKGYILVTSNFKEAGKISLTIRIGSETFYQDVTVTNPADEQKVEDLKIAEEEKAALLANISEKLDTLKSDYTLLENDYSSKERKYDLSDVNLKDLKNYIRGLESNLIVKDVVSAQVNLKLATEEYNYQKEKLDNAKELPKLSKMKDNALIFSTIAGALIMIFTVYELLKKKSENIITRVKTIKETKITETKKKPKKDSKKKKKK